MFSIVQDVTYRNMLFIAVFPQFIATSAEEQTLQNILLDWPRESVKQRICYYNLCCLKKQNARKRHSEHKQSFISTNRIPSYW